MPEYPNQLTRDMNQDMVYQASNNIHNHLRQDSMLTHPKTLLQIISLIICKAQQMAVSTKRIKIWIREIQVQPILFLKKRHSTRNPAALVIQVAINPGGIQNITQINL